MVSAMRRATGDPETARGWGALMARAQTGDQVAYRQLLTEITPYVRSIAARYHRVREDIEDAVQDVLLSVHVIRHSYDPSRPFGPWLATIADRRALDRLRKRLRTAGRETVLAPEHETFRADAANNESAGAGAGGAGGGPGGLPPGHAPAPRRF